MGQLAAIAADLVFTAPAFQMLKAQRIHLVGIPDLDERFLAHIADDQLASPVEETGGHETIRIHAHRVEDIGAGIGRAQCLLIDPDLSDLDARTFLDIEFRPAGREVLDEDAVAMIAERVEEFLPLRLGDELAGNLDGDFHLPLVLVEPLHAGNEFVEIEVEAGKFAIGLARHPVDGNIDLVEASLDDRAQPLRCQEGAVGCRVDIVDITTLLGIGDHIGKPPVQEGLTVLVHAQNLDRLIETSQIVDRLGEDVILHRALETAGLGDQLPMTGRAESAFEIAGTGRIDEDNEGRFDRYHRLERGAPFEVDARLQLGFHIFLQTADERVKAFRARYRPTKTDRDCAKLASGPYHGCEGIANSADPL